MRLLRMERVAKPTSQRAIARLASGGREHRPFVGYSSGHSVCSVVVPNQPSSRLTSEMCAR